MRGRYEVLKTRFRATCDRTHDGARRSLGGTPGAKLGVTGTCCTQRNIKNREPHRRAALPS